MHAVSTFAVKLRISSSAASTRRMLFAVRSPAWHTKASLVTSQVVGDFSQQTHHEASLPVCLPLLPAPSWLTEANLQSTAY